MDFDDSDQFLSDDYDIESRILAEQEVEKLKEQNESLSREKSTLQAQFESALNITKKMDEIHSENVRLAADTRNLQFEKDDIEKRLAIAIRAQEEMKDKLAEEKESYIQTRALETAEREAELAKIKQAHQDVIEKADTELKKLDDEKKKGELKLRSLENLIERVIQSASDYFEKPLKDINAVLAMFSEPRPTAELAACEFQNDKAADQLLYAKAVAKKYKRKWREAGRNCEALSLDVARLEKEIELREKKHQTELKRIEIAQREKDEERELTRAEELEMIKEINARNEALSQEVCYLNGTIRELKEREKALKTRPTVTPVKVVKPQDNSRELKEKIESLRDKLKDTRDRLQTSEEKKKEAIDKHFQTQRLLNEAQIEAKKYKADLESLQTVHNEILKEVQCLREASQTRVEAKPEKKKDKQNTKRLRTQIEQQEQTIKTQIQALQDMAAELDKARDESSKRKSESKELKTELEESNKKAERLESEIGFLNKKLNEKPKVTEANVLPAHVWQFRDFPTALSEEIDKIATNTFLHPAAKLHQIYGAIVKHYTSQIKSGEERLAKQESEFQKIKEVAHKFVVDISTILLQRATCFDELVRCDGGQRILEKAKDVVENLDQATRQNHKLSAIVSHFEDTFGRSIDTCSQITEIKNTLDNQATTLKKMSKKCRLLKSKYRDTKATSEQQLTQLARENQEQVAEISSLREEKCDAECQIKKLKGDILALRKENAARKATVNNPDTRIRAEYEREIMALKDTQDQIQQEHAVEIERLNEEIEQKKEEIAEQNSVIEKLKKKLKSTKNEIAAKESHISQLETEKESEVSQVRAQCQNDMSNLTETYEKTITELRQQCEGNRQDLEKISHELVETKKASGEAKKCMTAMKDDKAALEQENRSLQETLERERSVSKAAIRDATLGAETELKKKIQEITSKFEAEKRQLLLYAFEEFSAFFNASEVMDERSYRELLGNIRAELKRLRDSETMIRRLTGASSRQPTDDVIAELMTSWQP